MTNRFYYNILLGFAVISFNAAAFADVHNDSLPTCASDQTTTAWVDNNIKSRSDLNQIKGAWDFSMKVLDDPTTYSVLKKGAMLQCHPVIDVTNIANNPANVQLAMQAMEKNSLGLSGQAFFEKLINPITVGTAAGNGPKPSLPVSYDEFLDVIGRFPYFCGEKGTWPTQLAACQRELASFFAHAAQETASTDPRWFSILSYTREQNCYTQKCSQYDGGSAVLSPPSDAHYYGRGIKQLSWYYNYMGASSAFLGDYRGLIDTPDMVADKGYLAVGIGFWFAMTAQGSKPSIHDVMVGAYTPANPARGIEIDDSGKGVKNKFEATVSIINGGYECTPEPANLPKSKARFTNFVSLLNLLGVTQEEMTPVEAAYQPGTTYCNIVKGNPFADEATANPPTIAVRPYIYYNISGGKGQCTQAIAWEPNPPLKLYDKANFDACMQYFQEGAQESGAVAK
jgi:hypothetical protein